MAMEETGSVMARAVSRRGFLAGSGLLFGVAVGAGSGITVFDARASTGFTPSAWVRIGTDDTVTIVAPAGEMGQGVYTAMPMLFAEEMGASWSQVRVVDAFHNPKVFGNPMFGNFMLTGASRTTRGYWDKLRIAGAQVREVLIGAVSEKAQVPAGALKALEGRVVHAASGKSWRFGEIAGFAAVPSQMPAVSKRDLKQPGEWTIIGSETIGRVDIPAKVTGAARFGIDHYVEGMLYAAILRAPVQGEKPVTFNRDAVMKVKGVVSVVGLPFGVGVLATDIWASKVGKDLLEVTWSRTAPARAYTTAQVRREYLAAAGDWRRKGAVAFRKGDADAALKGGVRRHVASYWADHVYHATMEPMNTVAHVRGDAVEVWTPTQAPSIVALVASKVAGTKPNKVLVHPTYMGGGFGRRVEQDITVDAVLLSKMSGKPVKVVWSREDDTQHCLFRPAVGQRLEASLDEAGRIVGWKHRVVSESVFGRFQPSALKAAKGVDHAVVDGHQLMYDIPHQFHDYVREERGVAVGFWRSVGPGYTKFAVETFIDELAKSAGRDPVSYRLSMLKDARAKKVLRAAADMAGWGSRALPAGHALGVCYCGYPTFWQTHVALVAEVSVDAARGQVSVHKVFTALDPGVSVHPDNIVAQVQGSVVHGISHALYEQITFAGGAVEQSNFHDYRVLRMDETPEVAVQVMPSMKDPPGGMGEVALPPVAPAIANAIFAATGTMLRELPMNPDRVRAALKG
ncbi:MAG: molybdopterin-dependent oxidoreductase [Rhodospirillaceae bacterium]|nr:molybdopterin-dependent oxidoreductase [Rhodospirillaceae bacterium]